MTSQPTTRAQLAVWLRSLRTKTGLSQGAAASELKIDRRQIVRWEDKTNSTAPGALTLLKMLSLYGARIEPPPEGYRPADVASVIEEIADRLAELETQVIAAISRERADPPPDDGGVPQDSGAVER